MNSLPLPKWISRRTPAQSSGDANATIQLPFDGDTSGIADGAMDPDPSALVGTTDSVAMGSLFTASDPAGDAITQYLFWDGNPDPNSGYVVVNGVAQGKNTYIPITAGQLAQTTFQVGTAPDEMWVTAYDGAQWSALFFNIIPAAGGYQDPATVASGATLELTSAYSGTVTFAGPTGVLKLDQSGSFAGKIGGQLAIGDVIDLTDITAGASATIGYTGNNSPGTLTVSDGTHIASIALLGNYSLANFTASSDGHGGTSVVDPLPDSPVLGSSAQTTPAGPHLDANGWTVFTPSADTRTIYVSSSTGSDTNDGLSADTPVKTIAKGVSLLRDGYPDWLLLKKGDTWTNESFEPAPGDNFSKEGRSATEPMLISSYGTGARPLIQTSNDQTGIFFIGGSDGGNNVAVDGLDFYSYQRDPSNPNYVGDANLGDPSGIFQINNFNWQLIEDCKFSFYGDDLTYSGLTAGANLSLRRNVVVDAYNTIGNSQGLYAENINGLLLDGNVFDHDGWNASVSGGERTVHNRDVYLQWNTANVTALNNIFAESSSEGVQFRSGGTIDNNLFVGDSYGLDVGHNEGDPTVTYAQVTNNVITESNDIDSTNPRGGGINFLNDSGPNVTATNNIITQSASTNPVNAIAVMLDAPGAGSAGTSAVTVTGNIIYDWPKLYSDLGTGNILSNEVGPNPLYPDPTRSVGSYAATVGLTGSLDAFLAAERSQSKDNWNSALEANAVNNYIRAGFFAVNSITALLAAGVPITSTEGASTGGVTVTTFTDANPNAPASDFSATISWGDGTTSTGTVTANAGGGFSVNGAHNYADEGTYTVGVAIADDGGSTASAISTATVADAALLAAGVPITATKGASTGGVTVTTFTDANPNAAASDFSATISWGDGTTSTGTVSANAGGGFNVNGAHSYADEGMYTVGVAIADDGGSTASAISTATVADAVLLAAGVPITATEGASTGGVTVTTFTDANPNAAASDFSATISWGDGTTSTGTVSANAGGGFSVNGAHSYADEGMYMVGVAIADDGGSTASAIGTATVADAALLAAGVPITATEGASTGGVTVTTFTDANPNAAASDFSAAISWGDGTTSTGTVTANAGGGFNVNGAHSYADEGTYTVGVAIADDGGGTASAISTATVADAALAAAGVPIATTEGASTGGVTVTTFTDANPNAAASDFSAAISWGDGTTSTGTVTANAGGGFNVNGAHSFADAGTYTVGVTIADNGGSTATLTFALNKTPGETSETTPAQAITVTDPPVPSTLASAPGTLDQRVALLGQYMASTFATSGAGDAAILAVDQMASAPQQVSLAQPQH